MKTIQSTNINIDGNLIQQIKAYENFLKENKDNPSFKDYVSKNIAFRHYLEEVENDYIDSGIDFNMEVNDFLQTF